ncbi:MAG: DUF6887 family protein [Nostoc sp.]|uniref:Uncharacterized protein n=1 Tax=Nostoc punctiforme NIES-2108 TaxID=1356359 RepID=A0A367S175_NOSPU|nr:MULTISPECIES: hypothetical protein [unclassified Nostoc]MBN3876290.1 hypothetical protein [Nostoc sp. JL23]MBN3892961.1 hypothetical protein [Nostoc sp. JL31]RCJ41704.1 hypothetical protein A6769_02025 [Nostoc punctiforme NIES-2108]
MSKPDFMTMPRAQLRQYILEHREDDQAFETYLDRFTSEDAIIYPAPQSIDDLENFPELHQQNLERLRKQA